MALGYPYVVYGNVDDGSSGIKNAKITVVNNTTEQSFISYTVDDGWYQVDIQYISNIGNSITVTVSYKGSSDSSTFTIVFADFWKKLDFSLVIVIPPRGDMEIRFGGLGESEKIICYCTKWDSNNYSYTIETLIKKPESVILKNNIVPGAVKELYVILGKPRYYDETWTGSNTIKLVPLNHLNTMRSEVIGYVKNYSEHIINNEFVGIKMEINFNDQ
jgi:hypothetical protein